MVWTKSLIFGVDSVGFNSLAASVPVSTSRGRVFATRLSWTILHNMLICLKNQNTNMNLIYLCLRNTSQYSYLNTFKKRCCCRTWCRRRYKSWSQNRATICQLVQQQPSVLSSMNITFFSTFYVLFLYSCRNYDKLGKKWQLYKKNHRNLQCCGSGSGSVWIRFIWPDPDPGPGVKFLRNCSFSSKILTNAKMKMLNFF